MKNQELKVKYFTWFKNNFLDISLILHFCSLEGHSKIKSSNQGLPTQKSQTYPHASLKNLSQFSPITREISNSV